MAKVVKFLRALRIGEAKCYITESSLSEDDASGDYVSLVEYQQSVDLINELGEKNVQNRLLLDRWDAIAHILSDSPDIEKYGQQSGHLTQLIADTKEALK